MCSCGAFNSIRHDRRRRRRVHQARRARSCARARTASRSWARAASPRPTDPIWMNQYREDEIRAIVNERRAAHLRRGALPSGERGAPLRRVRRALHRARHADRRRHGALRREKGAFIVPDHGHHLRARRARQEARVPAAEPGEGGVRVQAGAGRPGLDAQGRGQDRLRHRPARRDLRAAVPRVHAAPRGLLAARDAAPGDVDQRRDDA